jgi:hypothetical protein
MSIASSASKKPLVLDGLAPHRNLFEMRVFLVLCLLFSSAQAREYLFDRPICTGLGDRLGVVLSLAALAEIEKATIYFVWCDDPSIVFPRIRQGVPTWSGYNYSMDAFVGWFAPSKGVKLISEATHQHQAMLRVIWSGLALPAESGFDSVYTLAWRTMRLHDLVSKSEFERAYRKVSKEVVRSPGGYVVLHMRGPDDNTPEYCPRCHDDPDMYCTGKIISRLRKQKALIYVVTNNSTWANNLLPTSWLRAHYTSSPFDDLALLLSASAIVQHAFGGWSSYSTVPALAAGVPIISTYRDLRPQPRLETFRQLNGAPREMFDCGTISEFLATPRYMQ